MNRRAFLRSSAAWAALAPAALPAASRRAAPRANKKAFMLYVWRSETSKRLSLREKFRLLREAGFHGVEVNSAMNREEVLAARDAAGLQIPSVVISTHGTHPLSSPNPSTRAIGLEGLRQGLRDAKVYGADSVLFVPANVNQEVSYADAYVRSVAEIKQVVPLAEELGVTIAIENVWNHFLLSPLEAAQYVDAFASLRVQWHLDIGNLVHIAWPEQWVRTLGHRIAKVHVKEYSRKLRDTSGPRAGFNVDLLEGDSDWPVVMAALDEVNYTGWLIVEQPYHPPHLSDTDWVRQLSDRLDRILAL